MNNAAAHDVIEAAARDSRARLLAFVAARAGGDLAAAEDALGDAFLAAVRQWPVEGVPANPEGWLLAAARRRLVDAQRRGAVRAAAVPELQRALSMAETTAGEGTFPDERLALLFVCAHPAVDAAARAPLMLQVVLGLDVDRIASAFLVSPGAMTQRLVRAKAKVRGAGVRFATPVGAEWSERLDFVLDAIYAAYNADWLDAAESTFARDATDLARLVARLIPSEPEALGLAALVLFVEARRAARHDAEGRFVPLPEQDRSRWDGALIAEAEECLRRAAEGRRPGRYQLEAAIQSAHVHRAPGDAIVALYNALVRRAPSFGARIGRAVAVGETAGAAAALRELDLIEAARVADHQPYWAARAEFLARSGQADLAAAAYRRAIGLCDAPSVRAFLRERMRRTLD